jgi:hypothetical protein
MNEISNAIENLELMSKTLEKLANKPENYNSYYGNHLEQMSWDMFKMSQELVQIGYAFGGV